MHYGGKVGTGWQPGLGNKCGILMIMMIGTYQGIMHQEGWQGGGIALCRWGTRVAAQSTIEVAAWVGQQGVWYCVVQCSKGWWWQCQGWWQGCNLHQTKRRQSCPGWEVDEPCLPQTHIPQLFLLIIIAVIVEHFPKTIKKNDKAPHFSLLPSHTLKHCY